MRCTGFFIVLLLALPRGAFCIPSQESWLMSSKYTGSVSLNHSTGDWINGVNTFKAGSKANFYVQLRDAYNKRIYGSAIQEEKLIGRVTTLANKEQSVYQTSFIANVKAGYELFQFETRKAAHYLLYVSDEEGRQLLSSPFQFNVTAGDVSVRACIADWVDGKDTFKAGEQGSLMVLLKDTFNNTFSLENGRPEFFELSISVSGAEIFNVSVSSQGGGGYENIQFVPSVAGKFFLQVGDENGTQVQGSPLTLYVEPGPLSVAHSMAEWVNGNSFQAGSLASLKIVLKDAYQNVLNYTVSRQTALFKAAMYVIRESQIHVQANYTAIAGQGYEILMFVPHQTGQFKIWVGRDNISISNSPLDFSVVSGVVAVTQCQGSWSNNINVFKAGDQAILYVSLFDAFGNMISSNAQKSGLNFSVKVQGRKGESIYIFGIRMIASYDNVAISFLTCLAGTFALQVESNGKEIQNSPLVFSVEPGNISIHSCVGSWKDGINSSKPGEELKLMVQLRDAFGNLLDSLTNISIVSLLNPSTKNSQGYQTEILRYHIEKDDDAHGYVVLIFVPKQTGKQWLEVGNQSEYLFNSPFGFFVDDGPISLEDTYARWKYGINIFPPYQGVKLYVYQRDTWGNAVESLAELQVFIYRENDTEPSPFTDVWSQRAYGAEKGTQLVTFTTTAPGIFSLYLEDLSGNKIGGCPYKFSVLASHLVQENKSVIYGSGLNPSIAGKVSTFFVQLKDIDGDKVDGYSEGVFAIVSIGNENEMILIGSKVLNKTGLYKVRFVLTRSGEHDILLLYCNIPLNFEKPFTKAVYAGNVSISETVLVPTEGTVPHPYASVPHPVTILLKDGYGNLVPGQEKLLTVKFTLQANHPPDYDPFLETSTGNYTFMYSAYEIQPCLLFIYYNDQILPGFPLYLYIHSYGFFPHPIDDVIWTWEDTAIIIDVLSNDYFGLKPGILLEITQQPINGDAYMRDQKIVYVPQNGFLGNDTLVYKVRDNFTQADLEGYRHIDYGLATIFVVKHPPQIISIPLSLEVCEEGSLPVKSGNKAFMIFYSKAPSPIAYAQISTSYGQIQTSSSFDLSWDPSEVSASLPSAEDKQSLSNSTTIDFEGENDVINSALDDLIYTGAFDFYGYDKILFSIKDEAGLGEEAVVIVKVKQINTPPLIQSYPFILVDSKSGDILAGVDDLGKEAYNASFITVMDEDIDKIQDDTSQVEVWIQVENGTLSITLPENSTSNTELKQEDSYHWSPLPTAVFENNEFTAQAQGIKFRATLKECNKALNGLKYNGTVDGTILSIKVNDLGHHGMDSVCSSEYYPLSAEKQLSFVFTKPMPVQTLHSYWKKAMIRTKVLLTLGVFMTFTFMAVIICLFVLVTWRNKTSKEKVKGFLYKESTMDSSRVYNPMWIPSAPSSPKLDFSNSSNPCHYSSQKCSLRQGLADAHEEMKSLLGFHIKSHWNSIKSFKSLSFKMSFRKMPWED